MLIMVHSQKKETTRLNSYQEALSNEPIYEIVALTLARWIE